MIFLLLSINIIPKNAPGKANAKSVIILYTAGSVIPICLAIKVGPNSFMPKLRSSSAQRSAEVKKNFQFLLKYTNAGVLSIVTFTFTSFLPVILITAFLSSFISPFILPIYLTVSGNPLLK